MKTAHIALIPIAAHIRKRRSRPRFGNGIHVNNRMPMPTARSKTGLECPPCAAMSTGPTIVMLGKSPQLHIRVAGAHALVELGLGEVERGFESFLIVGGAFHKRGSGGGKFA